MFSLRLWMRRDSSNKDSPDCVSAEALKRPPEAYRGYAQTGHAAGGEVACCGNARHELRTLARSDNNISYRTLVP
jgi:hypothetical protein